jgi:ketosteroid isomerase-like protein
MKTWWLVLWLAAMMVPASAQEAMRADANSPAEEEVKKTELDMAQLVVHGDWDRYAAYLVDDYSASDRNGTMQDKAETMATLRGKEKVLDLSPEELKVRVYGDTAIVSGHFTIVQRRNGRVDTFFSRQTHVFLKRSGRWFLAASHETSVGK